MFVSVVCKAQKAMSVRRRINAILYRAIRDTSSLEYQCSNDRVVTLCKYNAPHTVKCQDRVLTCRRSLFGGLQNIFSSNSVSHVLQHNLNRPFYGVTLNLIFTYYYRISDIYYCLIFIVSLSYIYYYCILNLIFGK